MFAHGRGITVFSAQGSNVHNEQGMTALYVEFFEELHLDLNISQTTALLPEVSDFPNPETK